MSVLSRAILSQSRIGSLFRPSVAAAEIHAMATLPVRGHFLTPLIVLYDHSRLVGFWASLLSLVVGFRFGECEDATGTCVRYEFPTPNFPDYPKYGVWPDAYYMTALLVVSLLVDSLLARFCPPRRPLLVGPFQDREILLVEWSKFSKFEAAAKIARCVDLTFLAQPRRRDHEDSIWHVLPILLVWWCPLSMTLTVLSAERLPGTSTPQPHTLHRANQSIKCNAHSPQNEPTKNLPGWCQVFSAVISSTTTTTAALSH